MHRGLALFCCVGALACGGPPAEQDAGPVVVSSDGGLDLNDVSFLYPLPPPGQESTLLHVGAQGLGGPLLPRAHYDALPVLVEGQTAAGLYPLLRIVSARVDPCFPGSAPPAPPSCVKQLRLVAQPVLPGGADAGFATSTLDATVHLFYVVGDAAFDALHRGLWELHGLGGAQTRGRPLGIHPVLAQQGLDGAYGKALNALILAHAGEGNLTRVAFMSVNQQGFAWTFGASNVDGGALVDDTIPRLNGARRQGVQEQGTAEFRAGLMLPAPTGDELPVILSERELRLTDDFTLNEALTSALRLEHPARSSPKTADCASCHVASRARRNAEQRRMIDNRAHADLFTSSRFDLRRLDGAGDDPHALRAFGYFGPRTALSQRTINESAVVADALSARRP